MKPAVRVGDATAHGAPLSPGPGSPNVLIGNRPAWRTVLDQHICPAVNISGADGTGNVLVGSPTVLINNQMACRLGDIVIEKPGAALGPTNPIVMGDPTVLIGEGGVASQIAVTVNALLNAAKSGVPLIQICPECKLLAALCNPLAALSKHNKPGDIISSGKDLWDAARTLMRASRAATGALHFGPDKPLDAVKKTAVRGLSFDWKGSAAMGALKTALNNWGDLKQGKYATFAAKVGYGTLRGVAGEAMGTLVAKGGVALGTFFPPAGGAIGGSAIGKRIGGLRGGKRGEKIGAVLGAIVGGVAGVAFPLVGPVLGGIGGKLWASDLTEAAFDRVTGGEEAIERAFNRGRSP